jgi:hypothetical protein
MFLWMETKQAQPGELRLFREVVVVLVAVAIAGETTGILLVVEALPLRWFVLQGQTVTQREFPIGLIEGGKEG